MLKKLFLTTLAIFTLFSARPALSLSLIRDAQTESYLKKISKPIFVAAGLDNQIDLYIVNEDSINAFVAGGKNIFINTGTITYADSPLGLIGILAHETGHITGSHLARMSIDLQKINTQMALGYILGIATAVAGRADAGQAVLLGSSHIGERQFYSFSTKHEEAADEAALKFLDEAQISAQGLLDFFKEIKSNEKLYSDSINPYTRTHPLTSNRILRISEHLESSPYAKANLNEEWLSEFLLIKVKIEAFLKDPSTILDLYDTDTELGKLAVLIAKHRLGMSDDALRIFATLKNNNTPYMQELKGQIEYESGRASAAVKTLTEVEKKLPDIALIKIELAAAIISAQNPELYDSAIDKLNTALIAERENVMGWRFLSKLYNETGNIGLSMLALAESEFFSGNYGAAIKYADRAKDELDGSGNDEALLRADDIIKTAQKKDDA